MASSRHTFLGRAMGREAVEELEQLPGGGGWPWPRLQQCVGNGGDDKGRRRTTDDGGQFEGGGGGGRRRRRGTL
jgi:hypothetical protein